VTLRLRCQHAILRRQNALATPQLRPISKVTHDPDAAHVRRTTTTQERSTKMTRLAPALLAISALAGCATAPIAMAQPPMHMPSGMPAMSSIQPETTITLMGRGSIEQPPDVAMINVGV